MKGVKVRTYIEGSGKFYKLASDAVITGGICFSIPFRYQVDSYYDSNDCYQGSVEIEMYNIHFYNGSVLTVPAEDFEKVVKLVE